VGEAGRVEAPSCSTSSPARVDSSGLRRQSFRLPGRSERLAVAYLGFPPLERVGQQVTLSPLHSYTALRFGIQAVVPPNPTRERERGSDGLAPRSARTRNDAFLRDAGLLALFLLDPPRNLPSTPPPKMLHSGQQYSFSPLDLNLLNLLTSDPAGNSSPPRAHPHPHPHPPKKNFADRRPPVDPLMVAAAASAGPE
jgi:hypothetical protein